MANEIFNFKMNVDVPARTTTLLVLCNAAKALGNDYPPGEEIRMTDGWYINPSIIRDPSDYSIR